MRYQFSSAFLSVSDEFFFRIETAHLELVTTVIHVERAVEVHFLAHDAADSGFFSRYCPVKITAATLASIP